MLEHTHESFAELLGERCSKFAVGGLILSFLGGHSAFESGLLRAFDLELFEMALNLGIFGGVAPCLVPINVGMGSGGSANDLKHPFGRVSILRTWGTSVADKVIDQNLGVFTDLSVVDGTSTTGQEKKTIETLEQHGTGLMDSAKNSLAVLLQLVQEIENSP